MESGTLYYTLTIYLFYRVPGRCKAGARTATCCAHVATTLYACGLLAHTPWVWESRWREYNIVDSGDNAAYTADILNNCLS